MLTVLGYGPYHLHLGVLLSYSERSDNRGKHPREKRRSGRQMVVARTLRNEWKLVLPERDDITLQGPKGDIPGGGARRFSHHSMASVFVKPRPSYMAMAGWFLLSTVRLTVVMLKPLR